MVTGVVFFLTSLSIFVILAEKLEAKISFDKALNVEIHSTLFAVELIFNKSESNRNKKSEKKRNDVRKFVLKIFSRSSASINALSYEYRASLPHSDAISRCAYYAIVSAIIAYFYTLFKNFECHNININRSEHNNSMLTFNAKLEITLLSFIVCLISCRFSKISQAIKGKLKISR